MKTSARPDSTSCSRRPGLSSAISVACLSFFAHHRLVVRAFGYGDDRSGLVDALPLVYAPVVLGGDGVDVAAQIGAGEAQFFRARGGDADREHGDVATIARHIVDQSGEGTVDEFDLHAEIARQFVRQIDVDTTELLGARIAVGDAVVVRPDADA